MNALDKLFIEKLGWLWVVEYSTLFFVLAAAVTLILLITLIIVAARHGKNKREKARLNARIAELENAPAPVADSGEYYFDENAERERLRAELEPQIRSQAEEEIRRQVEDEYASIITSNTGVESDAANTAAEQEIARLNATVAAQEKRIDELNNALLQSSTAHEGDSEDLFNTINELTAKNKQLQNDVNILRAENSQLKTQAKKEAVLMQARQKQPVAVPKAEEKRQPVKPAAAKKPPVKEQPAIEDDDDEDEYDNEFGDENSAVKVTLKFDRVKSTWVIYRSDTERAYRRLGTKQDALPVAKDLARRLHAQLVVHKKDGKFQRV